MSTSVVLGTRGSPLALAQARCVQEAIGHRLPEVRIEIRVVTTSGDRHLDVPIGEGVRGALLDKGMFTREIEQLLLDGTIDLAVHSLKDLPTQQPEGLTVAACLPRGSVRDVLVTLAGSGLEGRLKEGMTFGTGSLRRSAQLQAQAPGIRTVDIRGNVATRLRKLLAAEDWTGIVLARAGLERLGYYDTAPRLLFEGSLLHLRELHESEMMPAPGQGAIALQVRTHDAKLLAICGTIGDPDTFAAVRAERSWLAAMGGGCQAPLAAHAVVCGANLRLRAGDFRCGAVVHELAGETAAPEACGRALARAFIVP